MPNTREHTWGDELVVETFHFPGGLQRAVKLIHAVVGPYVGVRNTFARLLRIPTPAELDDRDRFRAWLLLTVYGQDPGIWGVTDDVVPEIFEPALLRARLRGRVTGATTPSLDSEPTVTKARGGTTWAMTA